MKNTNKTQKGFGRKVLETILGLATPVLAVLSPGCVEGYTLTPELGVNMPTKQSGYEYPETTSYGVRFGVKSNKTIGKTGRGIEGRVGIKVYQTAVSDAFLTETIDATQIEGQVLVPVCGNKRVVVYAGGHLTSQSERDRLDLMGTEDTQNRTLTGYGLDVVVRVPVARNCDIEASLGTNSFSKSSGEGTASRDTETNLGVGVAFAW